MKQSRRKFVGFVAMSPLFAFSASRAWAADTTACYDPAALPLSQRNRRRSLGYVSPAPQPQRRCGLCNFFASGAAGCGTCQLLSGGPVEAAAVCNSFAPKAK